MKENKVCRACGAPLIVGENITQYRFDKHRRVCRSCEQDRVRDHQREYLREWRHRTGRSQPMSENRECTKYLGVHVAEQVLALAFKNVIRMPVNNPGFDFKCGKGYMVDVKSACRIFTKKKADRWVFNIKKNPIAQYFLCLAFDNREDLDPEHVWLMPADDVNDHVTISIAETTLDKWQKYEQPIDRVMACCNTMKGGVY